MTLISTSQSENHIVPNHVSISNGQAAMDFKFLNDRYMRGKEKVQAFLHENHRLMCVDILTMGHASFVEMQAAMGAQGFLDMNDVVRIFLFKGNIPSKC